MTQRIIGETSRPGPRPARPTSESESTSASSQPRSPAPAMVWSSSLGLPMRSKASANSAAITKKRFITIIKTDLLIPGDGAPVEDAALVVEDKLIAWIGPQGEVPAEYTDIPHREFTIPYLMPGLWDVHVHCGGAGPNDIGEFYLFMVTCHPASAGARLTRGLWDTLQWGYTSIRDVAGLGAEVSKAIEDGTIVGPHVYAAGACISQTAGHGDIFPLGAGDMMNNLGVNNPHAGFYAATHSCIVDGVEECRRAVRLQIRRGARCIKVLASGGVMSRDDDPMNAQFSPEELEVIVKEAGRQKRCVAAHVHGKDGILAAVRAGVTSVEHVSFADKECIDLIKEKNVIYVATRTVNELLLEAGPDGMPKENWDKVQLCEAAHLAAYKQAIASGVTFAMGTDTPPGFPMAVELEYAVKAGMSNLDAIKAATANGPLTVGAMAPKTGQLKVGYEADLLGLLANPAEDVKVLQKQENIKWVWKGGKLFKGPGVGPWGEE